VSFGEEGAMRGNGEEHLEVIRRELQAILQDGKRVTERDLLRLSAQTGVDYSTVVRIQQEIS
jgi:plasmid maintenance system antidote protein VapI